MFVQQRQATLFVRQNPHLVRLNFATQFNRFRLLVVDAEIADDEEGPWDGGWCCGDGRQSRVGGGYDFEAVGEDMERSW